MLSPEFLIFVAFMVLLLFFAGNTILQFNDNNLLKTELEEEINTLRKKQKEIDKRLSTVEKNCSEGN